MVGTFRRQQVSRSGCVFCGAFDPYAPSGSATWPTAMPCNWNYWVAQRGGISWSHRGCHNFLRLLYLAGYIASTFASKINYPFSCSQIVEGGPCSSFCSGSREMNFGGIRWYGSWCYGSQIWVSCWFWQMRPKSAVTLWLWRSHQT